MATFQHAPDADTSGTSGRGEIRVAPARLVSAFGPPRASDRYKVSGQYTFTDEVGNVFTVYDYKATTLYSPIDQGTGLPALSPEKFWENETFVRLNIGGRDADNLPAFVQWLVQQLA